MTKKTNEKSEEQLTPMDQDTITNALPNLQGLTEARQIIQEQGLTQSNVVYDVLFKAFRNAIMGQEELSYSLQGEHPISPENIKLLKQMGIYDSEVFAPSIEEQGLEATTTYYLDWSIKEDKANEVQDK